MTVSTRCTFLKTQRSGRREELRTRRLPLCPKCGLASYDEHHQAADAVRALRRTDADVMATVVRCEHGRRWHIEAMDTFMSAARASATQPTSRTAGTRSGRLIILDIENATLGGREGAAGADAYLTVLRDQVFKLTDKDLVIVAAARRVVRAFQGTLTGPNVTWIAGADEENGADQAALDWLRLNLRRLAPSFEELVLITGDHAFTCAARRGQKYGLRVRVISTQDPSGRSTLSRKLAASANFRTTVRLQSRRKTKENLAAVHLVAGRKHRRVHVANPALVAA